MQIRFLGTGTSHGVPVIACDCAVCKSPDPRNARTRASIHIVHNQTHVLVDVPPEFRLQCIANNVRRVDAVLLTHAHADHIFGMDDLRRFSDLLRTPLPVYGDPGTLDRVRQAFSYVFEQTQAGGGKPNFDLRPVNGAFTIAGFGVQPMRVWHGEVPVTAYRIGRFAYVTDTNRIPEDAVEQLQGLHTLVLDALRHKAHSTHFSIAQAVAMVQRLRPERTFFTHMTHDVDYERLRAELPPGMSPAYDGLLVEAP